MAHQYSNSPYGDIYTVPTSAVDNIANRIYREQQIREQQKAQQDKALDDEFGKNIAGVKSADIPEITQAYNDFKQAHINLQKKGAKATPQDQMNVMLKKANAFQTINASKEDKARITQYAEEVKADKKGIYDPNAHSMLANMLNTPTSKRNINDDANLKYKYAMPNIDREIKAATGNGKEVKVPIGVDDKDPLKDKAEVYIRINPPNVFYNTLFTDLAARSDNKNFTRSVMDNITPDELNDLRTRYEAKIADPKFKAVYGEVKPFPESAGNTELGQAVAIKAMQVVDAIPIEKIREESVLNADRAKARSMDDFKTREDLKNKEWDRRRPLKFADSMALMQANKAAGIPNPDTGYLSDNVANEVGENAKIKFNGKEIDRRVIYTDKVDPERLSIINAKGLVKPIPIKQTDGTVKMGYYQDVNTGDWEGNNGQKISREAVKDRYISKISPSKFKTEAGTKASENTKTPETKPAVNNKAKIPGWN